ncbi:tetratricopeptide repeat protein [Bradyrhizobium sp. CCBAU 25360]|uniref:tetratricopeptide repeat protein n=1 Tax=Bradyrhizobium sp. CCBAU 25360 TaxID=858425 RepID=UPI0023063FE8|nr:hypothetical protein [Bradyrhizobium sp. CCBAU 25360]
MRPTGEPTTRADLDQETREAERPADLGSNYADALSWSGLAFAYVVGDVETGAALVENALYLNPNSAFAWRYNAWISGWLGQPERAIESALRGMRPSPVDPLLWSFQAALAYGHFFAGHYGEAINWAEASLRERLNPEALRVMAVSCALDNRLDQARKSVVQLLQLNPSLRISGLRWLPFRRADDWARYEQVLRMARLPE